MRALFLNVLVFLITFTQVMNFISHQKNLGKKDNHTPVIYWATDPNPVRAEQIELFRKWLKKKQLPDIEVRIDVANGSPQKVILQGISGVASDLIDVHIGNLSFFAEAGVLEALPLGDKEKDFFPAIYNDITYKGKRYGSPANIGLDSYIYNQRVFEKWGMSPPPMRWTFEQFEKMGKEFDRRANLGKKRRDVFFASQINPELLRRTLGISLFNETLTACGLNRNDYIQFLKTIKKWTDEDHLVPRAADIQAIAVDAGYGSANFQLFNNDHYGLLLSGRWSLIQIRQMKNNPNMGVAELPHGGFPCATAQARAVTVYQGSPHKKEALLFQSFLLSQEYSEAVVENVDAIPPRVELMNQKEYLEPIGHTNEWKVHEGFRDIANSIAVGREFSPYLLYSEARKLDEKSIAAFLSGVVSAEETSHLVAEQINAEIKRFVERRPTLSIEYQQALLKQKTIDELKSRGQKISPELIDNSFLKIYCQKNSH